MVASKLDNKIILSNITIVRFKFIWQFGKAHMLSYSYRRVRYYYPAYKYKPTI